MDVQAKSRIPVRSHRQNPPLMNRNIQLCTEMESLLQENMALKKKFVDLQRETIRLRSARLSSQKESENLKAALVQQQAENATLRIEAAQVILLLQRGLSEECDDAEKMDDMKSQRAEKQKSPSCFASIWRWMRERGEKKNKRHLDQPPACPPSAQW